ncbi:hypothetical protein [Sphingobacterium paucimobilis]|nr:hypothetical protein [Sphingobacterium paucimobilis]
MIRHILTILLLLLWCMLAAYLINVSVKLFVPWERTASPIFMGMYVGTVALMMLYVCMINGAYNAIVSGKVTSDVESDIKLLANYLLFAVTPPVLVHRVLLQVLVMVATEGKVGMRDIFSDTTYWKQDFPFLLLPLVLTALFFYYWPQYRIYKETMPDIVPKQDEGVVSWWRAYRQPNMLLKQLRKQLNPTVSLEGGMIRLYDIVFILYENKNYFAILTNGEKCLLPRFEPKMLNKWLLGGWFVKTSRNVRINMLYVQYPIDKSEWLRLDEKVYAILFGEQGKYSTKLCASGGRYSSQVKAFLTNIPTLKEEGWGLRNVKVSCTD